MPRNILDRTFLSWFYEYTYCYVYANIIVIRLNMNVAKSKFELADSRNLHYVNARTSPLFHFTLFFANGHK